MLTILDNVFTEEECSSILQKGGKSKRSRRTGGGNGYHPTIGECPFSFSRFYSEEFANIVLDKVRSEIPDVYDRKENVYVSQGVWANPQIHPSITIVSYKKGDEFRKHIDYKLRCVKNGVEMRSFLTVLIYLVKPKKGGTTDYWEDPSSCRMLERVIPPTTQVEPIVGRVVIQDHDIMHSGSVVEGGTKAVARLNVYYSRNTHKKDEDWVTEFETGCKNYTILPLKR